MNVVYRRLLIWLSVPICLFALAQCGLEHYLPYLTPPQSLPSGSFFLVRKVKANDSESYDDGVDKWEYLGIELYYKFYTEESAVETNYTKRSELESRDFHRISKYLPSDVVNSDQANSVRKPVLAIATGGDVDFTIDVLGVVNSVPNIRQGASTVVPQIRRGVAYDPVTEPALYPYFQRFKPPDDFDASDDDMSEQLYLEKGNIYMGMYALSYGKIQDLYDLYSDAVFLQYISIDFGW